MSSTTTYPATVLELGDMAKAWGMAPSELLAELGTIPEPPAGYILSDGVDGLYLGREIKTAGVVIVPAFDYGTQTHHIELWTGKGTEDEAMVKLCRADAVRVAADLTAAAA